MWRLDEVSRWHLLKIGAVGRDVHPGWLGPDKPEWWGRIPNAGLTWRWHDVAGCAWDCAAALLVFLGSRPAARSLAAERPAAASEKRVDFSREVRPILATRCFSCHGEKQQESGLRLDRRETALRGGENGVDIVPGKSSESSLVQRISAVDATIRMPPEGQRSTRPRFR